jgi:hypothetical protein
MQKQDLSMQKNMMLEIIIHFRAIVGGGDRGDYEIIIP